MVNNELSRCNKTVLGEIRLHLEALRASLKKAVRVMSIFREMEGMVRSFLEVGKDEL